MEMFNTITLSSNDYSSFLIRAKGSRLQSEAPEYVGICSHGTKLEFLASALFGGVGALLRGNGWVGSAGRLPDNKAIGEAAYDFYDRIDNNNRITFFTVIAINLFIT